MSDKQSAVGINLYANLRDIKNPTNDENKKNYINNVLPELKKFFIELETRDKLHQNVKFENIIKTDYFQTAYYMVETRDIPTDHWTKLSPYGIMVYGILKDTPYFYPERLIDPDSETIDILSHITEYYRRSPLVKDTKKGLFFDTQTAITSLYPALLEMAYNNDFNIFRYKDKFTNDQLNAEYPKSAVPYSKGLELTAEFRTKYFEAITTDGASKDKIKEPLELTADQKARDKLEIGEANMNVIESGSVQEPSEEGNAGRSRQSSTASTGSSLTPSHDPSDDTDAEIELDLENEGLQVLKEATDDPEFKKLLKQIDETAPPDFPDIPDDFDKPPPLKVRKPLEDVEIKDKKFNNNMFMNQFDDITFNLKNSYPLTFENLGDKDARGIFDINFIAGLNFYTI